MRKYFLMLSLLPLITKTRAQEHNKLADVTLIAIDTNVIGSYSVLTFRDTEQRYQVLVSSVLRAVAGCWEKIELNKKYRINLTMTSGYKTDTGILIPTQGRGLILIDEDKKKRILENDEFFYISNDIDGFLIRQVE